MLSGLFQHLQRNLIKIFCQNTVEIKELKNKQSACSNAKENIVFFTKSFCVLLKKVVKHDVQILRNNITKFMETMMSPLFLCNVTLEMWVPNVMYLHLSFLRNMLLQQFHNVCLCGRENIGLVRIIWDFNFNV